MSFVNDTIREMFDAPDIASEIPEHILKNRCFKLTNSEQIVEKCLLDLLTDKNLYNQANSLDVKLCKPGKTDKTITVSHQKLLHNGTECELTTFRDTTILVELRIVQEQSRTTNLLVSSVTHELLTPLRCIVTMTD